MVFHAHYSGTKGSGLLGLTMVPLSQAPDRRPSRPPDKVRNEKNSSNPDSEFFLLPRQIPNHRFQYFLHCQCTACATNS